MNKVYIVTSGEYSDYHIDAVFASYRQAKEYLKKHNNEFDSHDIEEWVMGKDYLRDDYWEIHAVVNCAPSLDIKKLWCNAELANARSVCAQWFTEYYARGYQTFDLMITVPKARFATGQDAENHCEKVAQDYVAKVKHMVQIDGMSISEATELIDTQLHDNKKEGNE